MNDKKLKGDGIAFAFEENGRRRLGGKGDRKGGSMNTGVNLELSS